MLYKNANFTWFIQSNLRDKGFSSACQCYPFHYQDRMLSNIENLRFHCYNYATFYRIVWYKKYCSFNPTNQFSIFNFNFICWQNSNYFMCWICFPFNFFHHLTGCLRRTFSTVFATLPKNTYNIIFQYLMHNKFSTLWIIIFTL